jgi:hypothetical protein
MRRTTTVSLLAAFLFGATGFSADLQNQLTSEEEEAGWILLFDGNSSSGWREVNGTAFPEDTWFVQDGCIGIPSDPITRKDIISDQAFTDYELNFEWRIEAGGNSGVKYLVREGVLDPGQLGRRREALMLGGALALLAIITALVLAKGTVSINRPGLRKGLVVVCAVAVVGVGFYAVRVVSNSIIRASAVGFEYQLYDDSRFEGLDVNRTSGALYDLLPPSQKAARPAGEFNESRIIVDRGQVEHWLNGVKLLEAELGGSQLQGLIEQSKFAPIPGFGEEGPGHIVLQNHGDGVCFRNIKVRELD